LFDMGPSTDATSSAHRRRVWLDHSERVGGLGSWEWTPATGELRWSDNHYRLFGLEPRSFSPSTDFVVAQVHPEDRARVAAAVVVLATGAEAHDLDYRIIRHDDVRHFRATFAVADESEAGPRRLVGSVQDLTSQRRDDRQLAARAAVSLALDEWGEFEPGAQRLLAGVAGAGGLAFGVLWVSEQASLRSKVIWHPQSSDLARVAEATRGWYPGPGDPTVGRAWESRQPVVSSEPWTGSPRHRADAIRAARLKAAMAIPVVAVDETLAVLEFLSFEQIELTDRLARALTGIGHEVGHFLARRRGELVRPVLTPRGLEILQLAAHGQSAAAIAEQLSLSRATVKRHFEGTYLRLGVSDRAAAVAEAMRHGLIT
jgi:DNA-binding CsgD family transcriptional regulator